MLQCKKPGPPAIPVRKDRAGDAGGPGPGVAHCRTLRESGSRGPAQTAQGRGPAEDLPPHPSQAILGPVQGDPRHTRMASEQERELRDLLARLKEEHRDLDAAIAALEQTGTGDSLQVQRLKKKKLMLKDRISHIEDQLLPDIIA